MKNYPRKTAPQLPVAVPNKDRHLPSGRGKRVLRKYNGIPRKHFHLFLKECEFMFNYGAPKQQLKQLKNWCT